MLRHGIAVLFEKLLLKPAQPAVFVVYRKIARCAISICRAIVTPNNSFQTLRKATKSNTFSFAMVTASGGLF